MGIEWDAIWEEIKEMCAAALKAYKPWMKYSSHVEWGTESDYKKAKAFHIIGFDVILDEKLKPW